MRVHAALVAAFAKVLRASADEILGLQKPSPNGHTKDRRFVRRLEKIDQLSKRDRADAPRHDRRVPGQNCQTDPRLTSRARRVPTDLDRTHASRPLGRRARLSREASGPARGAHGHARQAGAPRACPDASRPA